MNTKNHKYFIFFYIKACLFVFLCLGTNINTYSQCNGIENVTLDASNVNNPGFDINVTCLEIADPVCWGSPGFIEIQCDIINGIVPTYYQVNLIVGLKS